MTNQQAHARHLYFNENKTQKEIAQIVGVTERTIYNWIQLFSWHKLREGALAAPAVIADNLSSQLIEFQNTIAARDVGARFPTNDENLFQFKLINSFDKVKKYPGKGQSMQAILTFLYYIYERDPVISEQLMDFYKSYTHEKLRKGFKPYEMEHGSTPFIFTSNAPFTVETPEKENFTQPPEIESETDPETQYSSRI